MKKTLGMALSAGLLSAASALALQAGDAAPSFQAPSTAGKTLTLGDFSGTWLVLYFYPKSFTPGCTTEACSLRDGYAGIVSSGAAILGVSVDSLETQQNFKTEYHLPFDLLADTDGAVAKAYGVEAASGRAQRVTFIISPEGRIARVIATVKPDGHDKEVNAALRDLKSKS